MALFLTQATLYRVLQRELPEDVYPDSGRPEEFWSTASVAAKAEVLAQLYADLETVYDNYWPQTANEEGIALHEIAYYGVLSTDLTLEQRRDRILAKMRALPSLSIPDLTDLVESELPPGTLVRLVPYNADLEGSMEGGTWYLGVSELGVDTYLGAYGSHAFPPGTDVCEMDGSEIGLTPTEWLEYRANAYTYEVQIWDYTPTADELAAIELALTPAEPARSTHVVVLKETVLARLDDIPGATNLHLEAENFDGTTWTDSSGAGNHATKSGTPLQEDSTVFNGRKTVNGNGGAFHAPGDDFDATTERTYEIVIDDWGTGTGEYIIARHEGSAQQVANWLYKSTAVQLEAAVYPNPALVPSWMGSNSYSSPNVQGQPAIFHIVVDGPNRVMKLYQNGVQTTQNNNPLSGTLATPTGLALGIFSRWNQSSFPVERFTGKIMEVLRHDGVLFDQATIDARCAEFLRLKDL